MRLKEQGYFPAVAIGVMDIAGTGLYSSEYIILIVMALIILICSNIGLGWGTLNGSKDTIKNPLGYINDNFKNRPTETEGHGGQFQPSRYFSGQTASPFYGVVIRLE